MAMEDLYWNSIDFSSEESIPQLQKDYIDPWDLENYAYIRQHLDSIDLSSDPSSSLEEPTDSNSSSFYYLPKHYAPIPQQKYDSLMSDQGYAAIEEVAPWRHAINRTNSIRNSEMNTRRTKRNEQVPDIEELPYEGSNRNNSTLYIYETRARSRKVAMPSSKLSRERSMSFSFGDYGYNRRNSHYEIEDTPTKSSRSTGYPLYDDIRTIPKPSNFSLSNYGHLKIDYSYSWNSLDKYIYQ